MTIAWYDGCGYVGVVLILLAFFFLQAQKLHPHGWIYQLMNLLGAIGVMLSLLFGSHNWPAFAMELAWAAIALYGILLHRQRRRQSSLD